MENIYTVLLTAVTVLGSAGAWRFYERRAMHKEKDEDFIRHDCKDRISKLEALLESSSREKDELRKMIIDLTAKVATLQTTVEFLRKEEEKVKTTRGKRV
jgi:predicted RNase H-like nuclease (RuvC/YqgF family)